MSQPTNGITWRDSLRTSALLCAFFLIVYFSCNYITSLRHDVGTWAYSWERYIPFVPLMIVPYMSIDALFAIAPFLCGDRRELSMLARRLVMAISVAAVFFLAMPLRFSFPRPQPTGWTGWIFAQLHAMDRPYNQFPSLHIALRTVLADVYARHARNRWLRALSDVWFSLIGASTLLTYQHHVADVVGGFALAALCFYAIHESPWRMPVARNPRVGASYLAGSAVLIALATIAWPGTSILLWPALSLALVASAYFGLGPGIFRKHNGRLPVATWLLLWPVILGQRVSLRHYAKRSNAWDAVTPNVWLGRTLTAREADEALASGVTAILDVTGELPEAPPFARHPNYRCLPIMDLTAPTSDQLDAAVDFIDSHTRNGGVVYVHCKAGYSRSATMVAAYLLRTGEVKDADEAIAHLRHARHGIIIRPEALRTISTCRTKTPANMLVPA